MGYLLRFHDPLVFEALWDGWQMAARPKGKVDARTAGKIEDKLEGCSSVVGTIQTNYGTHSKRRPLNDSPVVVFLEDDQFRFLEEEVISKLEGAPLGVKLLNKLWDLVEETKKDWAGDEVSLRSKWDLNFINTAG